MAGFEVSTEEGGASAEPQTGCRDVLETFDCPRFAEIREIRGIQGSGTAIYRRFPLFSKTRKRQGFAFA